VGTAEQIGDAIRAKAAQATRDTMLLARANVTAATPVDTEHAMSNWVLSVGAPYTGVDGSRAQVSFAAQQAGDDAVRNYSAADVKAGKRIYLRDNVFYMRFLNRGSSQQAPADFIYKALTSPGSGRHMPVGTRRATKTALGKLARTAIRNRGRR
jgi:HK97 gp10 family phage protein